MKILLTILLSGLMLGTLTAAEGKTLAERLGYKATDKLLIVNGDDVGMCHAANKATIEAMEKGLMRSATIMVPCPWFLEIADYAKANPEKSFGIHLCHTSEWKHYRWGSVAPREQVPGLVDPQGYLWRSVVEVYASAKPEEAFIEGRAQIKKALAAGVDVTHIDSHMGTMQLHPAFVEKYLQLAVEFDVPARMASQKTLANLGYPAMRAQFAAKGIISPDYFVYEELKQQDKLGVKPFWMKVIKELQPGVTELYIHAGQATEELKAITGSWKTRSEEYALFTHDAEFRKLVEDEGIILIGYRALRDLQRKE